MVAKTKNQEFSDRLNAILDAIPDVPPKNAGRINWLQNHIKKSCNINLSKESVRKWLSGDSMPYIKRLGPIAKSLNTTTEYLIGEHNNMRAGYDKDNQPTPVMEVKETGELFLSSDEADLIKKYRTLSAEQKQFIRLSLDSLVATYQSEKQA